MVNTNQAKH